MDKRTKHYRNLLQDVASRFGCSITFDARTGSGHNRWIIQHHKTGQTRKMISAQSPSDPRAVNNMKAQTRRICIDLIADKETDNV